MCKAELSMIINKRIVTLSVAAALVLCLGAFLFGFATPNHAYAADHTGANLQSAHVSPAAADTVLGTQLVEGSIADDQMHATLKMAYGDKTTVSTNGASGKKVKWVSSSSKVVKVKSVGKYKGQFIAKGAGKATVTAYTGGNKLTVKVTVTGKLSKTKISVNALKTGKVTLKGAKVKKWTSADTTVAKVSKKGVITPMRTGSTTLTCKDTKGNKYECTVTVKNPKISCKLIDSFSLSGDGKTFYYKTFKLTNKSGKAIVLSQSTLRYFEDINGDSYSDLSTFDPNTLKYFSESPVTVASGSSTEIVAAGNTNLSELNSSEHLMVLKIGKLKYVALWKSKTGSLVILGRTA